MRALFTFTFAAEDSPTVNALAGIPLIKDAKSKSVIGAREDAAMLSIGAGLPPVPHKLVQKIQSGEFVDMAELLPDRMGIQSTYEPDEKDGKRSIKSKRRQVTGILEWVQCFSIYTAVIADKKPEKVKDLLGYQTLLLEAYMEYEGDSWLGYDRRFRQSVAACPDADWAKIDTTLWNMAFTGQAKAKRCKFCFSLTHTSQECDWAPSTTLQSTQPIPAPVPIPLKSGIKQKSVQVCYAWNHSQETNCMFPSCKYMHICLYCAKDPQVGDKHHKAIHCYKRRSASGQFRSGGNSQPMGFGPPNQLQPPHQASIQQQQTRYRPY